MLRLKHNSFNHIPNESGNGIPKVALVFSCTKNDEILVPGLLEAFNFCDFFICYYDDGTDFDYDESVRHRLLIREAEKRGAEWVYLTQPTMRCAKNSKAVLEPMFRHCDGIINSKIYYFWDYCLDVVRTDSWSGISGPTFFRLHPTNRYRHAKLHHRATPTNLPKINSNFVRYDLRRLGKEVCLAKANYYEAKDGSDHSGLRNFDNLRTEVIDYSTVAGLGLEEEKYIKQIKSKYDKAD